MNTQASVDRRSSRDGLELWRNDQLDIQRVLDVIGLNVEEIAEISEVRGTSLSFDYQMSVELKARIESIADICNLVFQLFDSEDKTKLWLQTPNPMLGYVTPRDMLRAGRVEKLFKFVADALESDCRDFAS